MEEMVKDSWFVSRAAQTLMQVQTVTNCFAYFLAWRWLTNLQQDKMTKLQDVTVSSQEIVPHF